MQAQIRKTVRRSRRKAGIRKRVFGLPTRPRLTIFRSTRHIYVQIIDDLAGRTLAAASTNEKADKMQHGSNRAAATVIGKRIAERAKSKGVSKVVFDRNGFRYHGRLKALADAAREGGLQF
ncbi:MAG TPA: 50S ribosomal protein L18 [Phycisphaerales bacterium]|nr:50S ribosomal protein L18 [Phycisphaerales bacterium]